MTIPVNVKKMENALNEMEKLLLEQKQRMQRVEKEFGNFKRITNSFIDNIKKGCEKKPRKPSGFVLPVNASVGLCEFLDIPLGSQVSRTEVTKFLIQYISDHNLVNPEKKTIVVPDVKLAKLLGDDVDLDTLTRFTIQKYMNKHYI